MTILPGKTPPVILDEGTFNVGDRVRAFVGTRNILTNEKVEIPFSSFAIVEVDGGSTPANLDPNVSSLGLGITTGITYRLLKEF